MDIQCRYTVSLESRYKEKGGLGTTVCTCISCYLATHVHRYTSELCMFETIGIAMKYMLKSRLNQGKF